MPVRMLKKSASGVLASLRPQRTPEGTPPALRSLRSCLGKGASRRARVGRVRGLVFLSIPLNVNRLDVMC
jgi:hypothetical protein